MGSKFKFLRVNAGAKGFIAELLLNLLVVCIAVYVLNRFFPSVRLVVDPFFVELIKVLGIAVLMLTASVPLVLTCLIFLRKREATPSPRKIQLAVLGYTTMILALAMPGLIYVHWIIRLTPGFTITVIGEIIILIFLINLGSIFALLVGRQ